MLYRLSKERGDKVGADNNRTETKEATGERRKESVSAKIYKIQAKGKALRRTVSRASLGRNDAKLNHV